jgi:predicted PurR-regulated permease PerM
MASPPAPSPDHADVPSWLNRLAAIGWRVLVTVALGIVILALARLLSTVTLSILFGVIAVATLAPLQERLIARGWGRAKASAVALLLAVGVVLVALFLILVALVPSLIDLAHNVQAGASRLDDDMSSVGFPTQLATAIDTVVTQIQTWLGAEASSLVTAIANIATIVMLGLFLTFYFPSTARRGGTSPSATCANGGAFGSGPPARTRCARRVATSAGPPRSPPSTR